MKRFSVPSVFSSSANTTPPVRIETCKTPCPPAAANLPAQLPNLLFRTLGKGNALLLNVFGPNGGSLSVIRGVNSDQFIMQEFVTKWQTASPDNVNDAAVVQDDSAATVSTADTWALLHSDHQRAFRDYATGGVIYRPAGILLYIKVPASVYQYEFGLTNDNTSPVSASVSDKIIFTFGEDSCRDIYIFIPRTYDPNGTNTVHTDEAGQTQSQFLNFDSENDPDTSAVASYLVQRAFDVSQTQVAVTIQTNSWLVFPTERVIQALNGQKVTLSVQNLQIAAS